MSDTQPYSDDDCSMCFGTGEGEGLEWRCPNCHGEGYIRTYYDEEEVSHDPT